MENNYYEEITSNEWRETVLSKSIPLNNTEINNLKKIFTDCTIFINNYYNYCSVDPPYKTHEINVLPDEWYVVSAIVRVNKIDNDNIKYYKCDQWDGLIELLKFIGDIK